MECKVAQRGSKCQLTGRRWPSQLRAQRRVASLKVMVEEQMHRAILSVESRESTKAPMRRRVEHQKKQISARYQCYKVQRVNLGPPRLQQTVGDYV